MLISSGEVGTLNAHNLIVRVSNQKSKAAFDLLCDTAFDGVRQAMAQSPAMASSIPTPRDCSDFLQTILEDDPLWQQILLKQCAHVTHAMTVVLTEIMARYLIDQRYVSLVTRASSDDALTGWKL